MSCLAITSTNKRCTRSNNNHHTGYCGIHIFHFYETKTDRKLGILSDISDNILRFPDVYTAYYNLPDSNEGLLLKRGTMVKFIAKKF